MVMRETLVDRLDPAHWRYNYVGRLPLRHCVHLACAALFHERPKTSAGGDRGRCGSKEDRTVRTIRSPIQHHWKHHRRFLLLLFLFLLIGYLLAAIPAQIPRCVRTSLFPYFLHSRSDRSRHAAASRRRERFDSRLTARFQRTLNLRCRPPTLESSTGAHSTGFLFRTMTLTLYTCSRLVSRDTLCVKSYADRDLLAPRHPLILF